MKKLATLVAAGLLFTGSAFAAPLGDNATSTSDPAKPASPNATDRTTPPTTTGSGSSRMTAPAAAKESKDKAKSPSSMDSGIKQEK